MVPSAVPATPGGGGGGRQCATPSEAAATATSESLRNMVVSSDLAPRAPSVKSTSRDAFAKWRGVRLLEPMACRLNETGTTVSERVHLGEIVVIPGDEYPPIEGTRGAGSLAVRRWRRYKPATSISASKDEIMAIERTFSIIKPDATERNLTGAVNALIEKAGLRIVAQKRIRMTPRAGRNLLCRAQGASVLRRAGGFHDFRPGRCSGSRRRKRRAQIS